MVWFGQGRTETQDRWTSALGRCYHCISGSRYLRQSLVLTQGDGFLNGLYKWKHWPSKNIKLTAYDHTASKRLWFFFFFFLEAVIWAPQPRPESWPMWLNSRASATNENCLSLKKVGVLISKVKRFLSILKSSGSFNTNTLKLEIG